MRIIRSSGGREKPSPARFSEGRDCVGTLYLTLGGRLRQPKKFSKIFSLGQRMSDLPRQNGRMKTYSTRYRRRTLLPVPYSVRPDRLERGIRMLRALRLSLSVASSAPRAQQREFDFALPNRA
jgi:hypothetical protein